MFGVAFYWEWFHRYLKSIGSTRGSAGRIDSYADTKIVTFFIGHNCKILRGILECPSLCGFDPTLNHFQWQGTAEAFWWPRSSEFLSSPQLLVQQGTVRIWQRTAWWRLFCVFNILRKRKAPASYKQFFCYVQVTVSGSPWSKCAVLAPRGQNQTRQRRNSIYKPSLLSLPSNTWKYTTSWATELLLVLPERTRPWTGPVPALDPQSNMDWIFRGTLCLL